MFFLNSELFLCTDTYLTKSLGLSHQYKHIWGQYGQAEVHQNDGPLWTNVPENQRKTWKSHTDNFNSNCFAVMTVIIFTKARCHKGKGSIYQHPFITFFTPLNTDNLSSIPDNLQMNSETQAPVSKMSSSAIWALASSAQDDNDSVPWTNGLSDRGEHW